MIGFKVTASGIDVTQDVISCQSSHPSLLTGSVPTCDIILSNRGGMYASLLPIFSTIQIYYPDNLTPNSMYFELENPEYKNNPRATLNGGRQVLLHGTAAVELLTESEGNMDVVGTDLPVPYWNARATSPTGTPDVQFGFVNGQFYTPYVSTYQSVLGTPLMDIGTVISQLVHVPQPNQNASYRGRLGYDCTGLGIPSALGIDYLQGALGYYIKGQWKVGQGSTGAQQYGIDIIKNIIAKNVIDGNGNMIVLDGFVDPSQQARPFLNIHPRGSLLSGQTITQGVDPILDIDLPYSTDDIMNFILYWANDEQVYPTSGDAWSNYVTTGQLTKQWNVFSTSGTGTYGVSTFTPQSAGTSIQFANTGTGTNEYIIGTDFNFYLNGYSNINTALRNLQSFNLWCYLAITSPFDNIGIQIKDSNGNFAAFNLNTSSQPPLPTPNSVGGGWTPITIPVASFTLSAGFSFSSSVITDLQINVTVGNPGQTIWLDQINFTEDYNFSPDYTYNMIKPASTLMTGPVSSGTALPVQSTAGFVAGQFVVLDMFQSNTECILLEQIVPPNVLILASAPQNSGHGLNSTVVGATHDPNSVAAYRPRIFNFVDFYVQDGASDGSDSIALSILQSRKGKKSTGTITLSGYAPQNKLIKPTSLITLTAPLDTYSQVGSTTDSLVTGYVVDQIDYAVDSVLGYTAKYTVEPWYATILSTSPDSNSKNFWRSPLSNPTVFRLNQARKANALVTPGF